jgi:diguanylate cyclase (GGDEF)-like protein
MNELLVQITVVAIAANVVLLLLAVTVPRVRRRLTSGGSSGGSRPQLATVDGMNIDLSTPGPDDFAQPGGSAATGPAPEPEPRPEPEPEPAESPESAGEGPDQGERVMTVETTPTMAPPAPSPFDRGAAALIDMETGLETAMAFEEAVRYEDARYARYGRSATVVVAELDRFDDLADRFGSFVADRLIGPVAATFRAQARRSDRVARVGHIRFNVLLPETDEVVAINYVERVREACDLWLENAAVSVRLVMGWASAGPAGSLPEAIRVAERRMHAERARGVGSRRGPGGAGGSGSGTGTGSTSAAGTGLDAAPSARPVDPSATAVSARSGVAPSGFEGPVATVEPHDLTDQGATAQEPEVPLPGEAPPASGGEQPTLDRPDEGWPGPGPSAGGPAPGHATSGAISPSTFTGPGGQRVYNRRSTDNWPRGPLPPTNQV